MVVGARALLGEAALARRVVRVGVHVHVHEVEVVLVQVAHPVVLPGAVAPKGHAEIFVVVQIAHVVVEVCRLESVSAVSSTSGPVVIILHVTHLTKVGELSLLHGIRGAGVGGRSTADNLNRKILAVSQDGLMQAGVASRGLLRERAIVKAKIVFIVFFLVITIRGLVIRAFRLERLGQAEALYL